MKKSRKAFTLVELLIVIVVIGILAGMMLFSGAEAAKSAEAAKITGNLTQLKKAFHLWYLNNHDMVVKKSMGSYNEYFIRTNKGDIYPSKFIKDSGGEIMKYISTGSSIKLKDKSSSKEGDYAVVALNHSKEWYVCYNLGDKDSLLKKKIAARQGSSQLIGTNNLNLSGSNTISTPYKNHKFVCTLMLRLPD